MLAATKVLSRQKYACHDKSFVETKLCLSRQNIFVETNSCFLGSDNRDKRGVCHDKSKFCARNVLAHLKKMFVATKVLSRQAYFCRDKRRVLSC